MKGLLTLFEKLTLIIFVLALNACTNKEVKYREVKVTIVRVWPYRAPNTLQEYEPLWKAELSDSSVMTFKREPLVGDTITYKFVY
jgi:hypothetical protein